MVISFNYAQSGRQRFNDEFYLHSLTSAITHAGHENGVLLSSVFAQAKKHAAEKRDEESAGKAAVVIIMIAVIVVIMIILILTEALLLSKR